jgi:hypothetical protein
MMKVRVGHGACVFFHRSLRPPSQERAVPARLARHHFFMAVRRHYALNS